MELFSEIYGAYFHTVETLLSRAGMSDKELQMIIAEEAFRDSLLFLPQKLRPESPENWGFLRRKPDGSLSRTTKHEPPKFLTLLQKRWLRAKLCDPKMRLFLSDEALAALERYLGDIQPLYPAGIFRYFDIFTDGDPYGRAQYRQDFRTVLSAIHSSEVLDVRYISGRGKQLHGYFLPLRLEYSMKNDKFRAYCCRIGRNGIAGHGILNIGRITQIRSTGRTFRRDGMLEEVFQQRRCMEPVQVEVTSERNGIERFLMEFASFEKFTLRNEERGTCMVWLWFDTQDETELLIRLLGFGPVLEILGPPQFRAQAAERVARQFSLLQEASEADAKKLQENSKNT